MVYQSSSQAIEEDLELSTLDECSQIFPDVDLDGCRFLNDQGDKSFMCFHESTHSGALMCQFQTFRREGLHCDVILEVEDAQICAHRLVLAASSAYFQAMFSNFDEKTKRVICLKDCNLVAIKALVDFMYSSEIFINDDNVQLILPASCHLQMNNVTSACCSYLQSQLHPSNCLGIKRFADLHGCLDLYRNVEAYIHRNFSKVIETDEYMMLSFEYVQDLIASENILASSEDIVYSAVIKWISFDESNRCLYISDLISQVKLPLMSSTTLAECIENKELEKGGLTCKDYLIEALLFHLSNNGLCRLSSIVDKNRITPRQSAIKPKTLIALGGQNPKAIRSIEVYDFKQDEWRSFAQVPTKRCRAGICVIGDNVFLVGGFNGSTRLNSLTVYNTVSTKWTECTAMSSKRSTLGVVSFNGNIYAIGGFDGSNGLCSAEVYYPASNKWNQIDPMSTRRSSVGVGIVDGVIYAVGGYDGSCRLCLSSVEAYCIDKKEWVTLSSLNESRSGTGVGVLNGLLYAVGGHDGPTVSKTVEVYNPNTDKWSFVAPMSNCRRNAGVIPYRGRLYVIGGDNGLTTLRSTEVYDPTLDSWVQLPSTMQVARSYAAMALVTLPDTSTSEPAV